MTASLEPVQECKSGITLSATAAVKFQQPPDSQKRQVLALTEKKISHHNPGENHNYFRCNFKKGIKALPAVSQLFLQAIVTSGYQ